MSMDYVANCAYVISEENLETIGDCGRLLETLKSEINALSDETLTLHDLACDLRDDGVFVNEESDTIVREILVDLYNEFETATGGATLYLGYHDSQEYGSRYDDLDGAFWGVDNIFELNSAGKMIENKISKRYYVQFG